MKSFASEMRPLRPRLACRQLTVCQRRSFLGLQRPPAPKPRIMGYLVAQGLAIVLLADWLVAVVQNEPTTIRSVFQSAGLWKDVPAFRNLHDADNRDDRSRP